MILAICCSYLAVVATAGVALLFCGTWGRLERRTRERLARIGAA